VEPSLPKL